VPLSRLAVANLSDLSATKKGPLAMSKRPKSREETPKEGSDNAISATAPQQYATAMHKRQGFSRCFACKICRPCTRATPAPVHEIINILQMVTVYALRRGRAGGALPGQNSRFRDRPPRGGMRPTQARLRIQNTRSISGIIVHGSTD
ncbi:hypothetical protein, partial [Bradyrhizobium sp.]|uniref:hypothetical protein n=1 Tax=Bradyrhizobium sp. TaxID=376 RepID=UPI003C39E4C6